MSRIVCLGLLALLLALPAAPSTAESQPGAQVQAAASDGKRKINLAGRQRMLTQRMAKAACFIAMGVDVEAHFTMLSDARKLFAVTLSGLRHGDLDLGLRREESAPILRGLSEVGRLWQPYEAALLAVEEKRHVGQDDLATIARLNLPVLRKMHETVGITERIYAKGDLPLHLAIALNISGRQRMFSQKMAKEFCLIVYNHEVAENQAALAETVQLFDLSLEALINGRADVGIRPPQGQALAAQLARVAALWAELKPIYERAAAGLPPSPPEVITVARENNPLLAEMNKAVWLYEEEPTATRAAVPGARDG